MSYDIVSEDVPSFTRRVGDYVVQGSNNTIGIFGTDRAKKGPATIDDGLGTLEAAGGGKGTGVVHFIAGRGNKDGNPDLDADLSYLYLAMKTDVDKNLGLTGVEADAGQGPAGIIKSDTVRLVFRKDIKISTADGKTYIYIKKDRIVLEGNIELGTGASEQIIKGNAFKQFWSNHQHPTGVGPSGPPIQPWVDTDLLSQRKATVK